MIRAATLCVLLLGLPAGAAEPSDAALRDWLDGPIHYIATPEEGDAFRSLKTDEARAAFVEAFWARRDPKPATLVNEYRQLFWNRVHDANDRFWDGARPGWMTDRGKVYILYGQPSRVEDDPSGTWGDDPKAGHGILRWFYEGSGRARKDINPTVVVVPFVRDVTGEYRLSSDPALASEFYDWQTLQLRSEYERFLKVDLINPSRSPLAVMLDMGRMQEVPPQEEVLLERVEAIDIVDQQPLPLAVQRYRAPSGDGAVLTLTVSLPPAPQDSPPAIIARVLRQGAPDDDAILLGEGSFRIDGQGADRRAQGRVVLDPGTYGLTVLAVEPDTRTSSIYRGSLVVPAREPDKLAISDVTLARELEPLRYAALASYTEPFVVGSFRVVPRVRNRLQRGEELSLFYEVYGGHRPYRATYHLEARRAGGWAAVARPVVQEGAEGAQGWSVPTSDVWPVGQYRVRIAVEDADGQSDTAELEFELADAGHS